jgi:hypothetical protein
MTICSTIDRGPVLPCGGIGHNQSLNPGWPSGGKTDQLDPLKTDVRKVDFPFTPGRSGQFEDLVQSSGDPALADTLDEVAEGMFVSQLDPDQTRSLLKGHGIFEEQILF